MNKCNGRILMEKEKDIYAICVSVDEFAADLLAESIVNKKSYDKLEAQHGILPISRRSFYRKRKKVQQLIF